MNLRELEAARASLVASLASLDVAIARARESSAANHGAVSLDEATGVLGSKRKAREWFNRAERAGFKVVRVGHAVSMDRAEWTRALEALASKRAPKSKPSDDESPGAIFKRAGLSPTRGERPQRSAA